MPDREKAIKALECCHQINQTECFKCPYSRGNGCTHVLMDDVLALLKSKEPVKPLDENYWKHTMGRCGHCKAPLPAIEGLRSKFCWMCGRPVKWDG